MSKITLNPNPFCVLKTRFIKVSEKIQDELDLPDGCKVFINICTDSEISPPEHKWIDARSNMDLPMVVSDCRTDVDKKGAVSAVFDCVMNTRVSQECAVYKECHAFVLQACLDVIERTSDSILDKDKLAMPKLKVKGVLQREYELAPVLGQEQETILPTNSLLDDTFEQIQELKLPNTSLPDSNSIETRKPLIQEITPEDTPSNNQPIFHYNKYSGPYTGPGSPPSHILEIETTEDIVSKTQLKLTNNGDRLSFGSLRIPLTKPASQVEAYFTKESNTLKAFIY